MSITGGKGDGKRGKEKRNAHARARTHTEEYILTRGEVLLLTTLFGDTWFIN